MSLHSTTIGDGPVDVVFLHGLFGQGKNWTQIAQGLADVATCRLVDLPNHGQSSWTITFSLDGQADLVAHWLRQHFVGPVAVVGHSLGGKIAMRLALNHPELVERLMVVDISPARNDAASDFTSLVAAMRNLDLDRVTSRGAANAQLRELIPDDVVRGFLLQNLRRKGEHWQWAANLDLLGDSLHAIGGWPRLERSYDGPVWWVAGGRSAYVQPEHADVMRELFPRVVTMTLKRAGHWVHADEPAAFIATCRQFLTS